jgi:4-amino-4-deoxy-L-arabinose transferase-like glycosyltransferase
MMEAIKKNLKSLIPEDWDIVLIFFFLAFALRLYFALAFDVQPRYREMTTLVQFAQIGEYDKFHPPLYIVLLRTLLRIFGMENFKAVYVAQGFFSALTVIPMYVIARRLCNRIAGGVAAAITAIYPNYILYSLKTLPDALSVFLVILLMLVAVVQTSAERRSYINAVITGIGMLVNPVFWFLIPGMLITTKKRIAYMLIVLAFLIPWVAYSSTQSRKFVPGYHTWAYSFDIDKYTQGKDRWHTVTKLYNNASIMVKKAAIMQSWSESEKRSTYATEYSYFFIMLLGLWGLIRYYRREHRAVALPILLYTILLLFFSIAHVRHRSLLEPLLIMYTSILAGTLCQRILFRKSAIPAQ